MREGVGVGDGRADLRREEFGRVRSVLGAGVAVEPGEIGKGEWLGLWIVRVGYLRLRLRKSRRWSRGFGRRCVMCLGCGGAGLLQLHQLLLYFLPFFLLLLDLLVLNFFCFFLMRLLRGLLCLRPQIS